MKSINGKEFFLVEVIAMILKYVKDRLLTVEMAKSPKDVLKASDFDWVITVPAMWKARGKQMMREAAYKVFCFVLLIAILLLHLFSTL